jgi:choline-sulfatase
MMLVTGWSCSESTTRSPTRNIVLVVIDTLRADHLQPYGYPQETSPRLAEFARSAQLFTHAHAHSSWTKPSVASILTAVTPRTHGIRSWRDSLDERFVSLAEHLGSQGVETHAIVSHIALLPRRSGFGQGFDTYDASVVADRKRSPHSVSTSEEAADRAIEFLSARRTKPFFLFLHLFDPHFEYIGHPEHDFGTDALARYDSEIAYTDMHLGRVLAALAETGLADDTSVVITADHGEEFLDHGGEHHTLTLYQEVLRVPLLIHVPGFRPAIHPQLIPLIDIAPTLSALLGLEIPDSFEGKAIPFGADTFEPLDDRMVFAETFRFGKKRAVLHGDWKLIQNRGRNKNQARPATELYHLRSDPAERDNRAEAEPEIVNRLDALIADYYAKEGTAPREQLDDETVEALQALGYLGDAPEPSMGHEAGD